MKYFLYARKSTEDDDKQIQSIDDQINYWKRKINSDIEIVDILSEEKSAKAPNIRKKFYEMIERIEKWEAKWILCWKLNRLSRNPVDTWQIQWMLQKWVIEKIITSEREYLPIDSWLIFSVETWIANQSNLDLSKDTIRGMQWKADRWWFNWVAPQWYLNDILNKTVVIDPERFNLIKNMWGLMLTWNNNPSKIVQIVNNEWWYRTKKMKKIGWKPLTKSLIYTIFHNPFYTWYILFKWKLYKWIHEPMITLEEFDRVQELLWRKWRPRPRVKEFAYTWIIKCSECGCNITAEEKLKYLRRTKETKKYIYYHCTHRKDTKEKKCPQRESIEERELEKQINEILSWITIIPEFLDWALKILKEKHQIETIDSEEIYKNINRTLEEEQKRLNKLTDMLLSELISEADFKTKKNEINNTITNLQSQRDNTEGRSWNWIDLVEKTFCFATYAQSNFNTWDLQTKREIFNSLGQNFLFKDWKLSIELNKWFVPIQKHQLEIEREYQRLEPTKKGINMLDTDTFSSLIPSWLPRLDSNQRPNG
jgi:site-specific DNA recombinase